MSWFDDPPAPPDPIRTASAATATNVGTSVANAFLNNINQVTPQGSLNYDVTSNYSWADPTTGQTYSIPRFTASQFLSPPQQEIQRLGDVTKTNLGALAANQSGSLGNLLGTAFNPAQGTFNIGSYLSAYPSVAAYAQSTGQNPYDVARQHYQDFGQYQGLNAGFQNPAPAAGNAGTLGFNAAQYLQQNPDVAAYANRTGQDPATIAEQHYRDFGQREGRAADFFNAQNTFADVGGQQRSLGNYGSQTFGFGDAGDITRNYGPGDFSADRQRVEESLYQRMDPQLQRDRAAMESRLADQGIKMGSPAHQAAMDQFNRQLTDTRLGITQTAGQEQQRMMDMAAQRAGFQNAAQQQAFTQQLGRGQFYNQAQAQQFQEQLQAGTFANQAQQQDYQQAALRAQFYNSAAAQNMARNQSIFGAQNQLRNQYISEQYAQRNQPINEITALLSGSQVTNPSFVNTPNQQIPTTDVAGLINNRFSQDMDVYKQQSANFNSLMGGIFGMMGGMVRSDRREKENIDRVGTVFAANENGDKPLPVYQYSYKDDPTSMRHVGPMAQDVEKVDRSAVKTRKGVKYIDTTKLGSILKVA
jgi:hypothetical protein